MCSGCPQGCGHSLASSAWPFPGLTALTPPECLLVECTPLGVLAASPGKGQAELARLWPHPWEHSKIHMHSSGVLAKYLYARRKREKNHLKPLTMRFFKLINLFLHPIKKFLIPVPILWKNPGFVISVSFLSVLSVFFLILTRVLDKHAFFSGLSQARSLKKSVLIQSCINYLITSI